MGRQVGQKQKGKEEDLALELARLLELERARDGGPTNERRIERGGYSM